MTLDPPVRRLRSRPLTFIFEIPTDRLTQFWTGLRKGKVYASKCAKCGTLSFPPVFDCSQCLQSGPEWVELREEGEIETFTHIAVRPASFADQDTYTVVVARMNEGVKVLAWLIGAKLSEVKVGAKVKLVAKGSKEEPPYAFTLTAN